MGWFDAGEGANTTTATGSPAAGANLQERFRIAMEELDRSRLMPMEAETYRCSAKCLEAGAGREAADRCKQECQQTVTLVNNIVTRELNQFQQTVQHCTAQCQQKVQDLMPPGAKYGTVPLTAEKEVELQAAGRSCVRACEMDALQRVPHFFKSLEGTIDTIGK